MKTIKDRFMDKVDFIPYHSCNEWNSAIRSGYGVIKENGKLLSAHRVSYELFNGDIPEGMYVCHSCDNRLCVNPNHLWLGTHSENMKDAYSKGRVVIPKNKHEFKNGNIPINRKLTFSDAETIRSLYKLSGLTQLMIAERYNVSRTVINDIVNNNTYKK